MSDTIGEILVSWCKRRSVDLRWYGWRLRQFFKVRGSLTSYEARIRRADEWLRGAP